MSKDELRTVKKKSKKKAKRLLGLDDFNAIKSAEGLREHLRNNGYDFSKEEANIDYEEQLQNLQVELIKLVLVIMA